jgi:AhpD family alkylhydroperoxidase
VHTTLARHPDLLRRYTVFAAHVLFKSDLPPIDRELIILRIGFRNGCEYEFAQHVRHAQTLGLTTEDINDVLTLPAELTPDCKAKTLLLAVDELFDRSVITDTTWEALLAFYTQRQMMDLVFAAGAYNLMSWALNSFGVQPDPGLEVIPLAPIRN